MSARFKGFGVYLRGSKEVMIRIRNRKVRLMNNDQVHEVIVRSGRCRADLEILKGG